MEHLAPVVPLFDHLPKPIDPANHERAEVPLFVNLPTATEEQIAHAIAQEAA